jgi:predicted amidohydrolase YtcJ
MYTLLHNARIYSLDRKNTPHSALLFDGDRIVFTGETNGINLPENEVTAVDLNGGTVVPGFIDCHTHVAMVALTGERLTINDCRTKSEALDRIREHIKNFSSEFWILGGGWDANIWPEGRPHKNDLDLIARDRPVALYNKDGHTMWMNSAALQMAGFDRNLPDPDGGKLGRDPDGELDGLAYEMACFIVEEKTGSVSTEFLNHCLKKLYPDLYRLGITTVHSCESLETYRSFDRIEKRHELGLRICMHPPNADVDTLISENIVSGMGNEWLRMGGLKYFMDGSLGSQTAEMFEPYEDLGSAGISTLEEKDFCARIRHAAEHGLSATVHAIGDRANHKTLNAFSQIRENPGSDHLRHRIEHAQILLPEDRRRFRELDIIASMQPMHIADDVRIADRYLGDRAKNAYPVNALLQEGVRVVFGSDMPVADPDPLKGMLAAVKRRYLLDRTQPEWHSEHAITPLQALKAYTSDAAYASGEENLKGSLEAGKLADFTVVSKDILNGSEEDLYDAKILMTVLGGRIVYRSDG